MPGCYRGVAHLARPEFQDIDLERVTCLGMLDANWSCQRVPLEYTAQDVGTRRLPGKKAVARIPGLEEHPVAGFDLQHRIQCVVQEIVDSLVSDRVSSRLSGGRARGAVHHVAGLVFPEQDGRLERVRELRHPGHLASLCTFALGA
jgi:hypothetical protein